MILTPSLFSDPSIFLTFIGLSNLFSLKSYFLANSELLTSPVAPLSSNTSTVIPSCISTLSSPIFTVTSHRGLPFLVSFWFFSNSNIPAFISVANTLNLLWESNQETLDSPPLLNCLNVCNFPQTPTFFPLLLFLCFYSDRQCAQILRRYSSFFLYLPSLHRGPF